MKNFKNYAICMARVPQYVITRTLYMVGWTIIAVANIINGDLDRVKALNQTAAVEK